MEVIIIIVAFCGHNDAYYDDSTEQRIKETAERLIMRGATEFLFGGYGNFDMLSAKIIKKLQESVFFSHFKASNQLLLFHILTASMI